MIKYNDFSFDTVKPNIDFIKIYLKNKNRNSVESHFLVPNYLKKTEAEEKLSAG